MKPDTILFLGREPSPIEDIQRAVKDSVISVTHASDWLPALEDMKSSPPGVVLIGPDIPSQDVLLLLERTKSDQALRDIPLVLFAENTSKGKILELITFGIRSYIITPCSESTLRCRLACHFPELSDNSPDLPQPPEETIDERLQQRMELNLMRNLEENLQSPDFPQISIVEQIFSQNLGLTIRENERRVSLYDKIDEMKLRLGWDSYLLIGILVQLLSAGKVRIGFRDKTERLSLADNKFLMTRAKAVELIDAYLAHTQKGNSKSEPSTETCRLMIP